MFGADRRKAGFFDADSVNVCGARNTQFERLFRSPAVRGCLRTTEEMALAISASRTIWPNSMWCIWSDILHQSWIYHGHLFEAGFVASKTENLSTALEACGPIVDK
jgi:hypothetical protein